MQKDRIIALSSLANYGPVEDLNSQVLALLKQQQDTWEIAGRNFAALKDIQTREFNFGHFMIKAHHNSGRIRSSAAKTDRESIESRPCFLCSHNLPSNQKGIFYENKFIILANPYPIFPAHLTIAHREHIPQRLEHFFSDMLDLSKGLYGFTVFYNGPQCGASAPDHFHFQAGSKGMMPVENELATLQDSLGRVILKSKDIKIYTSKDYLRWCTVIEAAAKDKLLNVLQYLYSSLLPANGDEPMINVLSLYKNNGWTVIIFPRRRQRPAHFYKSGEQQLLVSPAAVEMGGILILPRHEDFLKLNENLISEIYNDVTASPDEAERMISILQSWNGS